MESLFKSMPVTKRISSSRGLINQTPTQDTQKDSFSILYRLLQQQQLLHRIIRSRLQFGEVNSARQTGSIPF